MNQAFSDSSFWQYLPNGGISKRPFVTEFRVNRNGTSTVLWTNATAPSNSPPAGYEVIAGNLLVFVEPINMCSGGVITQGCYATPNRVGISIGCRDGQADARDFSAVNFTQYPGCYLSADSEIDLTINLNGFSSSYQWSWMNGNLSYWKIGTDDSGNSVIRMKFNPVQSIVVDWNSLATTPGVTQCCTCDMPSNCPVMNSTGYQFGANMFFHCQGSGLTGAVFATKQAVMGAMARNFDSSSNSNYLEYRLSSSHYDPIGNLVHGYMRAFLPLSAITSAFPALKDLSTAATSLNVTRSPDGGSSGSISFKQWTSQVNGADGIVVEIDGVTFSTPSYKVSQSGLTVSSIATKFTFSWFQPLIGVLLSTSFIF